MPKQSLQVSIVVRLFLALWLAITPTFVWAGSMTLLGVGGPAAGGGCSQATAFLARTSGLDGTHTSAYTTMICGMVTDGVWTKLDVLYILATQTSATALLNLTSSSFALTPQSAPTFTADQGYTGNGTSSYLDTGWIASTNGVNFTLNSASFGTYVLTNRTGSNTNIELGGAAGAFLDRTYLKLNTDGAGSSFIAINSSGDANIGGVAPNTKGSWIISRTGSTTINAYLNGNTTAVGSAATASNTLFSVSAYILAADFSGAGNWTTDQTAAVFFGGSLSSTDQKKVSDRINTYMSSLAVPVNVY